MSTNVCPTDLAVGDLVKFPSLVLGVRPDVSDASRYVWVTYIEFDGAVYLGCHSAVHEERFLVVHSRPAP